MGDEREAPVGKEYAGPSGIGRDSHWLTAEDLVEGKDVTVSIAKVLHYPRVKFQGGRVRENMLGLQFVGKERVLGLNATNRKILNSMFGNITQGWKGQKVTLYVSETQMAGETVKCVRIRKKGSRAATAAEDFLHGDDAPQPESAQPADGALVTDWRKVVEAMAERGEVGEEQLAALIEKHGQDYEAIYADVVKSAQ